MKERLLSGWSFQRVLYVLLGGYMIVQSIAEKQWVGTLPGIWFASMGVFALGCAGGNCMRLPVSSQAREKEIAEAEFEEVK